MFRLEGEHRFCEHSRSTVCEPARDGNLGNDSTEPINLMPQIRRKLLQLFGSHRHRFIRMHAQSGTEAFLEQAAKALGTFTQRALKSAQLIGQ
ncbi:hypothetical protein C7534_13523 [Pseudomonas sp. OV226]|nr:hypothetical protein C7534_13523 [Pseudomonas sp. OV226]